MKQSDRLSQVEALLGPELSAKYRDPIEFGVHARISPKSIARAIRARAKEDEAMQSREKGCSCVAPGPPLGSFTCAECGGDVRDLPFKAPPIASRLDR